MEFDEAKNMLAQSPPPEISDHRSKMASLYGDSPQKLASVDLPLREIEANLADLARHGHFYKLVEVESRPGDDFPRMLYKDSVSGPAGELTVQNQGELEIALKDGWMEHRSLRPEAEPETGPGPQPEPEPVLEQVSDPQPEPNV